MKFVTKIALGTALVAATSLVSADDRSVDKKFPIELTVQQMEQVNAGGGFGAALAAAAAAGGIVNVALTATQTGATPFSAFSNSASLSFVAP